MEVFTVWDYLVVSAMLVVSAAIGLYFRFSGGRQSTTEEYLMGGRDMGMVPVLISLMATVQTAVGTLGFPGEVYLYGAGLYVYPLGFAVALVLCTFVHTPVYFGIQVTSAYEYLEKRFGKVTRTIISGLFVIQMVLFMSVGLYSPSIALSAVSGLSHIVSILAVGTVCAFYCTLGGMKAVLWSDVFQSVLMFLALLSVIVKGTSDVGGVTQMIDIARRGGRIDIDTTFDPTLRFTVWSSLIGGFMYGVTTCGANQTQVQRLLTVRSLKRAQFALLLSIPANLLMYYTIYTCGMVIYANFAGCDPLMTTETSGIFSADQLIPFYMVRSFGSYPGMSGFCVSGVFCAALTSISSAVNSLAAVTVQDFVRPFCGKTSEKTATRLSKFFALFYSVLCIGMTYLVGNIRAIIPAAFVVFTAIGGPTLAIITLGMITTTANQKGIVIGLVLGIAVNAWIGTGAILSDFPQVRLPQSTEFCSIDNATTMGYPSSGMFATMMNYSSMGATTMSDLSTGIFATTMMNYSSTVVPTDAISTLKDEIFPLFRLSFLLHPVPGTILTLLLGYVASAVSGGDTGVDENLICPFMRRCLADNTIKGTTTQEANNSAAIDHVTNKLHSEHSKNGHIVEESKL